MSLGPTGPAGSREGGGRRVLAKQQWRITQLRRTDRQLKPPDVTPHLRWPQGGNPPLYSAPLRKKNQKEPIFSALEVTREINSHITAQETKKTHRAAQPPAFKIHLKCRRLNGTFYVGSCGFRSVSLVLAGLRFIFFGRSILANDVVRPVIKSSAGARHVARRRLRSWEA